MGKQKIPVIAIFDVGKTNKKLFLFDANYQVVFERSARFLETTDEDGDACENLESLRLSVFDSLHEVFRREEFEVKAINFTSYGASFVYLDKEGRPITPLYNYLKAYPEELQEELYAQFGGEAAFSLATASPSLGSLNSGLQLYRIKKQKPEIFAQIVYALHLPQYLSYLISGKPYTDMTSIGCHTALWDYPNQAYHQWVKQENLDALLPPLVNGTDAFEATFPGSNYLVGAGLHDSSAALIPYLLNFHEPFILISTGTWCISFNPFNHSALTEEELQQDCLFYLTHSGTPVKASRLFAGHEHEVQSKRIADYFEITAAKFRNMPVDWTIVAAMREKFDFKGADLATFGLRNLLDFASYQEAYHTLILDLVQAQVHATSLVMGEQQMSRIFVDGGFGKNAIYMNLIAERFKDVEVFAASMAQATAIGAALVMHQHWNTLPIAHDLIELRYFRGN